MNKHSRYRLIVSLISCCIILMGAVAAITIAKGSEKYEKSVIEIHNPFHISVNIEMKCNWDGKRFRHHKFFRLNGKSKIVFSIPNSSNCQFWPGR